MYLLMKKQKISVMNLAGTYSGSSARDSRLFGRIAIENRKASALIFT